MLFKSNFVLALCGALTVGCLWSTTVEAQPDRRGFNKPGVVVRSLPRQNRSISVSGRSYSYSSGVFYERRNSGFVVVRAPVGARVHSLPAGFISFGIGNRRYSYVNSTYYLWDDRGGEYVVVAEPEEAKMAMVNTVEAVDLDIFIYPRSGQSEEQRDQDRYECHLWSKDQTGFDPSAQAQDTYMAADYKRAISACLEGREYTVK